MTHEEETRNFLGDPNDYDHWEDEYEWDEEDECEDEFESALMNCGMDRSGLCSKAGSEECDWECPWSGTT